ncbi:MAG: membrane assembly protein AsmA [Bacteroidetes bacterium]|nr:membrane assembly protein AsmA [Bacteroidota bacterium]
MIKKILKVTGILFLILLIAIIVLPFIFKDKIVQKVKDEVNKQLNAKVDFKDYGLSLFRSFPDFSLELNDLTVIGIDEFQKDTLANIPTFYASIDLMSVIKGDNYKIKKIKLDQPKLHLKVLKGGKANWDISKPSADTTTKKVEEPSTFKMTLKKFEIVKGNIWYEDDDSKMYLKIKDMNHTLKGDFTADNTSISTETEMAELNFSYDGVKYFNKAKLNVSADLEADLKNSKYTFKENEIKLNDLTFGFDGWLAMPKDDIDMDLKFSAKKSEFKNFLSLIPGVYSKDFDKIETKGTLAFDGSAKGIYNSKSLPAFALNIQIQNAMFKYPDLPKAVTNIQVDAKISNKGGGADNTVINIPKMHFEMAGNPMDIKLLVSTPVSDALIDAAIKGKINLADVKLVYPLEKDEDLNGQFTADVKLKGSMSSVDKGKYDEFNAAGNLLIQNLKYKSKDFPNGVNITNAQLDFTPQYLDLVAFNAKMGKSDIAAKGKINNYMAYFFKNELLKGTFAVNSNYFNCNEFLTTDETAQKPATDTTSNLTVFKVPANLDFTLNASFNKLLYDNYDMSDVNGAILIRNEQIDLNNLNINMLGGKMAVSGSYNTKNPRKPAVDFNLNINQFDIQQSYKTFVTIKKFAPIAEKTFGNFSAKFNIKTSLDEGMMPILKSIVSDGGLNTSKITVTKFEPLNKIAQELKIDKLSKMVIEKIDLIFSILDGKIHVKPFDIKYEKIKGTVSGYSALDESINYVINMEIPRSEFGSQANSVLNNLVSQANSKGANAKLGDMVKVDILLGGTIKKPTVKIGLKGSMNEAIDDLKNKAKEEIDKKKEEIKTEIKEQVQNVKEDLSAKAKKILDDAQLKANQIREEAKKAGDKLIAEADAQGKKLVKDASNPIAKIAAQKAADKLVKEAKTKAAKLNQEADTKSNKILDDAKKEADKIK